MRGELRRGRPKASEEQKVWEAEYLRRRVERWARVYRERYRDTTPMTKAYQKVAQEKGWKTAGLLDETTKPQSLG